MAGRTPARATPAAPWSCLTTDASSSWALCRSASAVQHRGTQACTLESQSSCPGSPSACSEPGASRTERPKASVEWPLLWTMDWFHEHHSSHLGEKGLRACRSQQPGLRDITAPLDSAAAFSREAYPRLPTTSSESILGWKFISSFIFWTCSNELRAKWRADAARMQPSTTCMLRQASENQDQGTL